MANFEYLRPELRPPELSAEVLAHDRAHDPEYVLLNHAANLSRAAGNIEADNSEFGHQPTEHEADLIRIARDLAGKAALLSQRHSFLTPEQVIDELTKDHWRHADITGGHNTVVGGHLETIAYAFGHSVGINSKIVHRRFVSAQ